MEKVLKQQNQDCKNCKRLSLEITKLKEKIKEKNYYGSDLNKFINKNCTHKMSCVNIDTTTYMYSKNRLRVIESKHENETMSHGQKIVLELLAEAFKILNKHMDTRFGICIVVGEYPYENIKVHDLITGESKEYYGDEVIKFLEMD